MTAAVVNIRLDLLFGSTRRVVAVAAATFQFSSLVVSWMNHKNGSTIFGHMRDVGQIVLNAAVDKERSHFGITTLLLNVSMLTTQVIIILTLLLLLLLLPPGIKV